MNKGFTLVELAIVLTIIGLLVGGILKGQEMIVNARVNATVAQIQGYQAAAVAFQDVYSALPGDLGNAPEKLRGCTLGCTIGASDNFIGNPARTVWANTENGDMGQTTPGPIVRPNGQHRAGGETWLFWMHLLLADLITGVTEEGLQSSITLAFGSTHPATRFGGGFMIRTNAGRDLPLGSTSTNPEGGPGRIVAVLIRYVSGARSDISTATNRPLSTAVAEQIDRKMDDGIASRGDVQGLGANCYAAGNNSTYNLAVTSGQTCGLVISLLK